MLCYMHARRLVDADAVARGYKQALASGEQHGTIPFLPWAKLSYAKLS